MAIDSDENAVLSSYFDGDIDREEAVERVGPHAVKRAESEYRAVEEDVDWGLGG